MSYKVIQGDCEQELTRDKLQAIPFFTALDLTFLDPPFNQGKDYARHNDDMPEDEYWAWMTRIARQIYELTSDGGAIYFMQREKNAEFVLCCLREAGWQFRNLIIWKKLTSAVPIRNGYGKHYQIIAFAIKGNRPRVFNKLRIDPPLPPHYKYNRQNGMFVTDLWDDIRELTSGYFAGDEALRNADGSRFHKQQAPMRLLARIILSSTAPGDTILDPFAGTGTTAVVAAQLKRKAIAIELDARNAAMITARLENPRASDDVSQVYADYEYTECLDKVWARGNVATIHMPATDRACPTRLGGYPSKIKLY